MTDAIERTGVAARKNPGARPLIVGIGGTTREGSSSEIALRTALVAAEAAGAETRIISGADLDFPMYAPEQSIRSASAIAFVDAMRLADGVILSSPGYHGSISGLIKNALDYLEDTRCDARPYLEARPVGCIVCAHGWQATGSTLAAMRSIVHALRGWPTPFGATINTSEAAFREGLCIDSDVEARLAKVASQVLTFAQAQRRLAF